MIYLCKQSTFSSGQRIRRVLLSLLTLVLITGFTFAQKTTIKGKVTDASNGEALPGVNINIDGTTVGVITDFDGNYVLNIPSTDVTLVFSYMGYLTTKQSVAGRTEINVGLEPDVKKLEEVVVIGYGTVKKKDLTGAVSSIGGDKMKDIPITSAAEALTGKLAGVQITTTEGSPDAEIKIRVRGGGSITQDNSPLYIVDGFPVSSINDIAPSDIASIDVLKDASSTAIYGSRGANGVIIITTKSGKEGKISVNYNGYYGVKKLAKSLDVLGVSDYVHWQYEQALLQDDVQGQYEKYYGSYTDIDMYDNMTGNDWQKQVLGSIGTSSNHSISASGGSENIQFNFSYNRIDEKTIMLASNFKRDNVAFKLNAKPSKKASLGFSVRYSDTEIRGSGANEQDEKSSSDSRLKNIITYTPIPLKDLTSSESDNEEEAGNLFPPTVFINDNDRIKKRKNLNLGVNASYEIIKGLKLRTEIGTENQWDEDDRYFGLTTYFVRAQASITGKPAVLITNEKEFTIRNSNTLTYELKNLGKGHNLNFLVGEETQIIRSETLTNDVQGLPVYFNSDKAFKFTTEGDAISIKQYYNPDDKLVSFFGRVNYDFNGKYLATITYRADGSSKFGKGNQWGYFPSAAVAWRISDEQFMKGINWLDNLKIRASLGTAGNNRIPSSQILKTFSSNTTTYLSNSLSYWGAGDRLNNEKLKWETTYTRNVGLDFGVLKNRINGTFEMYYNNTKDLLILVDIPGSGYKQQYQNIGETSNKGVELTLNTKIIDKKDLELNFSFNIGINRNKIVSLGGSDTSTIKRSSGWTSEITMDYKASVGRSVGEMYGYKTSGRYSVDDFTWDGDKWVANAGVVDNSDLAGDAWGPGALKLEDQPNVKSSNPDRDTTDGIINANDIVCIGNANPLHTGGFTISGRYKNFDFTSNFNWSYGNDIYNANKIEYTSTSKYYNRNMTTEMESGKRWTNIDANGNRVTDNEQLRALNANTTMWSPLTSKYIFHSWAVEDGSFLRLSSLTIGYTIPDKLMNKIFIKQFRVYTTAYNVICRTNYSGFDPEVDTRRKDPLTPGVDYSAFPRSRSIVFGVNLSF